MQPYSPDAIFEFKDVKVKIIIFKIEWIGNESRHRFIDLWVRSVIQWIKLHI